MSLALSVGIGCLTLLLVFVVHLIRLSPDA